MNKITNIFEEYLAIEFRKDKEFYRDDFDEKEFYGVDDFDKYIKQNDIGKGKDQMNTELKRCKK